ncbi:MAG TPA: ABC transporter permease, partial [Longimicrobiales bacterium]
MRALNRKLLREVWRLRGQMLSIALVVAAGVMTVVTMRGTYTSLTQSLDRFYRDYHFAHVFAELKRAPEPLARRIEEMPGAAAVQTRVRQLVTLDVPGLDEPATGLVLSIPPRREPGLNDIHLIAGRYVDPDRPDEVLVSESFATANGLQPGAALGAVINGRWRRLEIVGIAISPDYIGELAPGTVFPDDRRFAILRMNRTALAAATGMEGSFNEVSVALAPDGREGDVIAGLDRLLEPYGGLGAYGRDDHLSHQTVMGELDQNRVLGTVIPAIFLGVAAFLLNIVLGRLVGIEREQIAVLKAFGYSNIDVGRHYLRFALVAVLAGGLFGTVLGVWFGGAFTRLYGRFFRFPHLEYVIDTPLILIALGISAAAAALGALGAVRSAVRLAPAEAMRPEGPIRFRPGPLERTGLTRLLPASVRMIVRNVERRPMRSAAAAIGVAFSVALLVVSMFFFDAINRMLDVQFAQVQREDLAVYFGQTQPASIRHDLANLEGVMLVELFRTVPVRLSHGHAHRSTALSGLHADGALRRIIDQKRGVIRIPAEGVVLTTTLADILGVGIGDTLQARLLEGDRSTHDVAVAATADELFGLNAYMSYDALHRMLGEAPAATGGLLRVLPDSIENLNARVKRLPAVVSAYSPAVLRQTFDEQMDENLMISVTFLVVLAGILAVGVIYNGARIALSERGRELASLRVLGFTRREVAVLLLGEQGVIALLSIPLGWAIGLGFGALVLGLFDMERYRIPMVITEWTYIYSALIAIASAAFAGIAVRRRLDRLDLIEVLKT